MMFKKCSNFHWFILRGCNFIKTVYELFDNPSYNNFNSGHYFNSGCNIQLLEIMTTVKIISSIVVVVSIVVATMW